jgi:hypothetical protein
MTAASLGTDESDAPYFQTPRGGMKNSRDSMGAACNWQSAIRGLHFVTGSHQQTAEEYRRRFLLKAADQEKLARISRMNPNQELNEMIVYFVRICGGALANCQLLIASCLAEC